MKSCERSLEPNPTLPTVRPLRGEFKIEGGPTLFGGVRLAFDSQVDSVLMLSRRQERDSMISGPSPIAAASRRTRSTLTLAP